MKQKEGRRKGKALKETKARQSKGKQRSNTEGKQLRGKDYLRRQGVIEGRHEHGIMAGLDDYLSTVSACRWLQRMNRNLSGCGQVSSLFVVPRQVDGGVASGCLDRFMSYCLCRFIASLQQRCSVVRFLYISSLDHDTHYTPPFC